MKKVLCVIIACLIIFGIYSCAPANINNVTTDGDIVTTNDHDRVSKEMTESDFFDFSKLHKPSDKDIRQIEVNTELKEVIDRIGKPHDFGPTQGITTFCWETIEGNTYFMYVFAHRGKSSDESMYYYLYDCSTVSGPYPINYDVSGS